MKILGMTLHKTWSFPLRISSVNLTKSAVSCGFAHIYWRNLFVQRVFSNLSLWSQEKVSSKSIHRSSHQKYSLKKGVLRNLAARVSFLINLETEACNFIKKETLAQVFFCEFCEVSKNTLFTEHLWATASVKTIHSTNVNPRTFCKPIETEEECRETIPKFQKKIITVIFCVYVCV